MRVLVVGSGGREHALAWKLGTSDSVNRVFCAPGNPGTAQVAENLDAGDLEGVVAAVEEHDIDLTVVGPEALLVEGLVDRLAAAGRLACGPTAAAARLEGSKAFAKDFMRANDIPTARYQVADDEAGVREAVAEFGLPVVLKADGLAAGKGVLIIDDQPALEEALSVFFAERRFGASGDRIVVEEFLVGEEVSFIALCDGRRALPWAPSKDYKRVGEGDTGPNTGGMGAYSPAPVIDDGLHDRIMREIMLPTLEGMRADGAPFTGFLYAGLMMTAEGPKVLEFNARFGDPEAQPVLMRLDSDLVALCRAAVDGRLDEATPQWDERAALGVVLAAAGYPRGYQTGHPITGLDAEQPDHVKVFHAGTAVRGGDVVTAGGRVLCVTALGSDVAAAQREAYKAAARIGFEGAFKRGDIGHHAIHRERT